MLHVGLTGNIASGKSSVARLLAAMGVTVIDSDVLARDAVAPGTPALQALRERFGEAILLSNGELNREALRRIVFHDPVSRETLNQIVHPVVGRLRDRALAAARMFGDRIVVSDVPLLFEVGLEHTFDDILFVDAPEDVRLARLMSDRHLPEDEARAMMSAQWPAAEKRARSTFVIDNDGTLDQLAERVRTVWHEIEARAGQQ